MTSPRTGISRILRGSTCGRMSNASDWMPRPRNGAARPNAMDQPNIAPVGLPNSGRSGIASERVPRPVRESRPMKMSVPMPADKSPGTSTTPTMPPPSPEASSSKNAPRSGEPRSELIAAKLPAPAITARAVSGASRAANRMASAPSPLPSRISGASGPMHHSKAQPGQRGEHHSRELAGREHAPGLNPSAGEWPPMPGR